MQIFYPVQGNMLDVKTGIVQGVQYQAKVDKTEIWYLTLGSDNSPNGPITSRGPDLIIPNIDIEEEYAPPAPGQPIAPAIHVLDGGNYRIDRDRGKMKQVIIDADVKAKVFHPRLGERLAQSLYVQYYNKQVMIFNAGRLMCWISNPKVTFDPSSGPRKHGQKQIQYMENELLRAEIESVFEDCGCPAMSAAERIKPHIKELRIVEKI